MTVEEMLAIGERGLMRVEDRGSANGIATYNEIFDVINATQIRERVLYYSGLGLLQTRDSGGLVQTDHDVQRYSQSFEMQQYSLRVEADPAAMKFDIYKYVKEYAPKVQKTTTETLNKEAANILVLGNVTTYGYTAPDAAAIFGTHTRLEGNTYVNVGTAAFSSSALQTAVATVKSDIGERGIPRDVPAGLKITSGYLLEAQILETLKSRGYSESANQGDNLYLPRNVISQRTEKWINDGITSGIGDNWYLTPADKLENPLKLIMFLDPAMRSSYDEDSLMMRWTMNCAFKAACFNDGGTYASIPA